MFTWKEIAEAIDLLLDVADRDARMVVSDKVTRGEKKSESQNNMF